jgi:hypothetical protein
MKLWVIAVCVLLITAPVVGEENDRLPYGTKFGQKYDASEHETIRRRGNVRSVKLKTAERPDDTEDLRAEICDEHGLQVITWRSHIRSLSAASLRHTEIAKGFTTKFGRPQIKRGSSFWKAKGFYIVLKIRNNENVYQNQIRYFGPQNEPCFERLMIHQQQTK